ncbi:MAG: glycosyltransferase family 4 protein [Candidatus Paceibacterota bacterium]|jgi:glycosyltransferase involved in cell wall biosynthesis
MTKKLIYLANIRLPTEKAHGLQIMKMCEAFAKGGFTVELWIPWRFNRLKEDPFAFYGLADASFVIRRNFCLDLNSLGFLGLSGYLVQTFSFLLAVKIKNLFNQTNIFYSREAWASLFFNHCVLEVHDLPKKVKSNNLWLWRRAGKIIVLTAGLKAELARLGLVEQKILVAPDGVDLEEITTREDGVACRRLLGLPPKIPIVMYVGSFGLYDWKGIDVLLESVKFLSPEIVFVLVGGSAIEIARLKEKYSASNIVFKERVNHKLVPFYLKSADVLVLPNKSGNITSERYTSPLKLFEYLASGVPVVASDLPSIREVLNEGNSILVKPNNASDLAQGISRLLGDPDLSQGLSRSGLETAKLNTWTKRALNIINFSKIQ